MDDVKSSSPLCERAQEWASLDLDGELSAFEGRLLQSHLERCAPCNSFAARLDGFTAQLRLAPPESLRRPPMALSPARGGSGLRAGAAAAALLVAAIGLGGFLAARADDGSGQAGRALVTAPIIATSPDATLRPLRLTSLRPRPDLGFAKHLLPL
ncbi:MAG: zf-HC2 domain-containing protein [Actinobacteria bacterium]|nr:zf-HC2 domain-containing protein [Actinomycetota bacterium]